MNVITIKNLDNLRNISENDYNNVRSVIIRYEQLERNDLIKIFKKFPKINHIELKYIDLDEFPDFETKLENLKYLEISFCGLTNIPSGIKNFPGLVTLKISDNFLTNLPEDFINLKKLKFLNISDNLFTERPDVVTRMMHQISLINHNNPTRETRPPIREIINRHNNSNGEVRPLIREVVNRHDDEVENDSDSQDDSGSQDDSDSEDYSDSQDNSDSQDDSNSEDYSDSQDSGSESGSSYEDLYIIDIGHLRDIVSQNNVNTFNHVINISITDRITPTLNDLVSMFTKFPNVKSIHLSNFVGINSLPEFTKILNKLTDLEISNCNLKKLPDTISNFPNLTSLDVHGNKLKDLPDSILNLQHLTKLRVTNNNFRNLPRIVPSLQQRPGFQFIDRRNAFTAPNEYSDDSDSNNSSVKIPPSVSAVNIPPPVSTVKIPPSFSVVQIIKQILNHVLYYDDVKGIPLERDVNFNINLNKIVEDNTYVFTDGTENVRDYLRRDPDNMVFIINKKNYFAFQKSQLKNMVKDRNSVVYECKKTGNSLFITANMVEGNSPYLNLRSIGLYGILKLAYIKTIINSPNIRIVNITKQQKNVPIASMQMLQNDRSAVSAVHCQQGSEEYINTVTHIPHEEKHYTKVLNKKLTKRNLELKLINNRIKSKRPTSKITKRIAEKRRTQMMLRNEEMVSRKKKTALQNRIANLKKTAKRTARSIANQIRENYDLIGLNSGRIDV